MLIALIGVTGALLGGIVVNYLTTRGDVDKRANELHAQAIDDLVNAVYNDERTEEQDARVRHELRRVSNIWFSYWQHRESSYDLQLPVSEDTRAGVLVKALRKSNATARPGGLLEGYKNFAGAILAIFLFFEVGRVLFLVRPIPSSSTWAYWLVQHVFYWIPASIYERDLAAQILTFLDG